MEKKTASTQRCLQFFKMDAKKQAYKSLILLPRAEENPAFNFTYFPHAISKVNLSSA